MTRIVVAILTLMACGSAQAAAPEFNTEHFCGDFAEKNGGDSMGGMAKAVCLLSEQSTKTIVDKAWDHVSAANQATCLKAAKDSYVYLAKCLSEAPGQ